MEGDLFAVRREFGIAGGDYMPQKAGVGCESLNMCHGRLICAIEGECVLWKANMCRLRRIVEGEYV